jgi:signal transduction histidine kinase
MLRCHVSNERERQELEHPGGPLEFGRIPRGETPRCVINDPYVSKDHLRVTELPDGRLHVENLSKGQPVWLSTTSSIPPGGAFHLELPARLAIGETVIDLELSAPETLCREHLATVAEPIRAAGSESGYSLTSLGLSPSPETLVQWFETVCAVQRAAPGTPEFYRQTAQAVVDLVGLDRGLVLLRQGDAWQVVARAFRDEGGSGREFSTTILRHVVAERRTFYQSAAHLSEADSLQGQHAVVASPVFDMRESVVGAVYGSRGLSARAQAIGPLEAQVVQLLAAIVSSGLVRLEREAEATRMRVAMEAAAQADAAKSQFLANVSHELRTPLNAIIGYTEMLQEEAADLGQESFLPDLAKILSSARHLLTLINDILDLSRIVGGGMKLLAETFDVAAVVKESAATVLPTVQKNGNALEVDCPDGLGTMYSDMVRVRQCLLNLLSNACKFTEKGTVRLTARRLGDGRADWVQVQVADSGIGMSPEQLQVLGSVWGQAGPAITRKYGGSGLGLAITFQLCRLMGGDVTVASAPGKGSTFTMRLPAQLPPVQEPPK